MTESEARKMLRDLLEHRPSDQSDDEFAELVRKTVADSEDVLQLLE